MATDAKPPNSPSIARDVMRKRKYCGETEDSLYPITKVVSQKELKVYRRTGENGPIFKSVCVKKVFALGKLDWESHAYVNQEGHLRIEVSPRDGFDCPISTYVTRMFFVFYIRGERDLRKCVEYNFSHCQKTASHTFNSNEYQRLISVRNPSTILYFDIHMEIVTIDELKNRSRIVNEFNKPNETSDCVFYCSDGKKVYINSGFMAEYSNYFISFRKYMDTLEKDFESGLPMQTMDIVSDDLMELLSVVYPSRKTITGKNIETIMQLANRFLLDATTEQCCEYIHINCDPLEQLHFAETYDLPALKKVALHELKKKSADNFPILFTSCKYKDRLSVQLKAEVLDILLTKL